MSAAGFADKALVAIESGRYGFILINYANADMVGHSGNFEATVRAVEEVDSSLGRVYELLTILRRQGGQVPAVFVTADHGNAEKMFDPVSGQPHTAHTANPVPLILLSDSWQVAVPRGYMPGLIDVAPSALTILGLQKPLAMTGISIVGKTRSDRKNSRAKQANY